MCLEKNLSFGLITGVLYEVKMNASYGDHFQLSVLLSVT